MEIVKLIAAFIPILLLIVGAAIAYLRLFIRNELNDFMKGIREEFVSKEVFETAEKDADRRFVRLENAPLRR